MTIEQVLKEQPFQHVTRFIAAYELKLRHNFSGTTYKVLGADNRHYKLRLCTDIIHARKIEENVKLLPHWFPKFHGRIGKYVLFDWIEGNTIPKQVPVEVCRKIGQMMGEAHALDDLKENNLVEYFTDLLNQSRGEFSEEERQRILTFFHALIPKLKIDITREFHDTNLGNLLLDKDGRLYFVDEDGISHKLKGLGMAKPLITDGFISSEEQVNAFWEGYKEYASDDFFTKDYAILIDLIQNLRMIRIRKDRPEEVQRIRTHVLEITSREKAN